MAQLLNQILGHERTVMRLQSALAKGALPHGMIFSGPSGIGKRAVAIAMAQAILCESEERPCGKCPSCIRVGKLEHEFLLLIEPSKGQIRIEQTRSIVDFLNLRTWRPGRVIVIDQAHAMTPQAGNALLKALEEPPDDTYFFLLAPSAPMLLPTLRSRCQIFQFGALSPEVLRRLRPAAPAWAREAAQGRVELLDQMTAEETMELRKVTHSLWRRLIAGQNAATMDEVAVMMVDRETALAAAQLSSQLIRDGGMSFCQLNQLIHRDAEDLVRDLAGRGPQRLMRLWQLALDWNDDLMANVDRTLATESFLLRAREALR